MNASHSIILLALFLLLVRPCDSATNHKPHIDTNEIVIKVREDAAVGTSLRNLTAIDPENDAVTFGLDDIGQTILNIVKRGPRLGELTLKKKLNRESVKSYDFHVTVTDGGDDRKTSKLFILNVLDVNDNKPVFVQQPYWISIPENTTVGTSLLTIQATDADLGTNAAVTYRFSNDSNSAQDPLITLWKTSKFSIDKLVGKITLSSTLDYETTSRYMLPVVTEDGGDPKLESQTTVIIDVTDISDNPPKFERSVYLKEIDENTPVGTSVLAVVARDGDIGVNNPIKYEIYSGNDGMFAIESSTGIFRVNDTIDAEKSQSYKFYVRASEVPDPSSNATVSVLITVIDKNDNPPVFSQDSYTFKLREDLARPGRIITDQLTVKDADKNPEFRRFVYHVTGGDSDKFSIDPSSGELTINSTLDYDTQVNYTFTIVVTEIGTAEKYSDSATVHLTLINDNDNKPIFGNSSYHYTLDEEIPPGREIAVVTVINVGVFGQIKYELLGPDMIYFQVNRSTGLIETIRTLDYEQSKSYQFYILAKDGWGLQQKVGAAVVNIALRDVNDNNPVFSRPIYNQKISRNMSSGEMIIQVTASDRDSGDNGRISYRITDGNSGDAFSINGTGYVTTNNPLDPEKISYYTLMIMAYDHGVPRRSETATLTVYGNLRLPVYVTPTVTLSPPLTKGRTSTSSNN